MVESATETFDKREEFGLKLNAPAFQILICALCRYKHVQEAEALLNLRQNDFPMDMKSPNIILNGWCALANLHGEKRFWNELIKQGPFNIQEHFLITIFANAEAVLIPYTHF